MPNDFADRLGRHARPADRSKPRVNDAVARPARTSLQYGVAVLIVAFIHDKITRLDGDEKAWALLIALAAVNAAWVAIENQLGAGFLRQVPPTKVPVVDEAGESVVNVALVVLIVVVILVVLL